MSSHNKSLIWSPYKLSITKSDGIYNKDIKFKANKGRCSRVRTKFTEEQILQLEQEFQKSAFLDTILKIKISKKLNLNEKQVISWFQNRRMKQKRSLNIPKKTSDILKPSSRKKEKSEKICPNLPSYKEPVKIKQIFPINLSKRTRYNSIGCQLNPKSVEAVSRLSKSGIIQSATTFSQHPLYNSELRFPTTSSRNSSLKCSPTTKSYEIYNKDIQFKADKDRLRRLRIKFTEEQILQLEQEFQINMFLDKIRRIKISEKLNLKEQHVKVWFQNRRMKRKRSLNFLAETHILRQIRLKSRKTEESENICPNLYDDQKPVKILKVFPIQRGLAISSLNANQFKSPVTPQQHFPNTQHQTSNYDFQRFQQNVQQHTLPHNQLLNNNNATQNQPQMLQQCRPYPSQYQYQTYPPQHQYQTYRPQYHYQTYPPQYQYQTYRPQYPTIVGLHQQQGNTSIHQLPVIPTATSCRSFPTTSSPKSTSRPITTE